MKFCGVQFCTWKGYHYGNGYHCCNCNCNDKFRNRNRKNQRRRGSFITDRIFEMKNQKKLEDMPTHTIHYGHIHDGDEVIDEVMVVLMRGPKSYTREDTVEIDCHGGVYVMKRI